MKLIHAGQMSYMSEKVFVYTASGTSIQVTSRQEPDSGRCQVSQPPPAALINFDRQIEIKKLMGQLM